MDTKTKDEKKKKKKMMNSIMYNRTNICDIRTNPTHHHNNNNQNPTTTTTGSTKETLSSPTSTTMTTTTIQQQPRRCCHCVTSFSTILSHPLALPLTAILHPNTVVPLDYQVYPSVLLYKVLYEDFSEDDDHDLTHHHYCIDDTMNDDGPTSLEPTTSSSSLSLPTWTTTTPQLDDVLESTMTGRFGCCTHTFQNHPMWTNTLIQRLKQYLAHVHHPLMVQLPSPPPPNGHPTPSTHHHDPKKKSAKINTNQEHQCPFHIILVDPTSSAATVMRNKKQPPLAVTLASVVTAIQISTTTTSSMENASLNSRHQGDHQHWSKAFETGMAFLDTTTTTNHSSPCSSSNQHQQQHVRHCYQKPMIFVNISIDTNSDKQSANTNETTTSTTIRIGCFLCTRPKTKATKNDSSETHGCNTKNIHTILLWRDEYTFLEDNQSYENSDSCNTKTIKGMSKSFGNIIRASTLCYYYRDLPPYIQCKYLSPNCSLYDKNMVLRCYDSRMYPHENERRSDVYLQQRHVNDTNSCIFPMESCADVVLSLLDSNDQIDGAIVANGENNNIESLQSDSRETASHDICPMDWLWQFQGKLVVIATPYRPGYHYAQCPTDFIPIIEHLQYLHNNHDIVHGDIRASNMVFSTKKCRRHKLEQARASPVADLIDQVKNHMAIKRKVKKSTKKEVLSKMACTVMTTIKSSAMTTIKDVLSTRSPLMRPMSSIEIPIGLATLIHDRKIIFDTTQGCLIDFDFGGLFGASTTRYPTGYNRFVYDGYRIGQEHQMIQYKDDWYALIMVIFQVHVFTPPSIITENDTYYPFYKDIHQLILKRVENTVLRFCSIRLHEHGSNDIEKVQAKDIVKLKRLLIDMEAFGYTVSQRLA